MSMRCSPLGEMLAVDGGGGLYSAYLHTRILLVFRLPVPQFIRRLAPLTPLPHREAVHSPPPVTGPPYKNPSRWLQGHACPSISWRAVCLGQING